MGYQSIYNRLRAAGLSQAGALAMLGNWECESNCESFRLQGDFDFFRTASKAYVAGIESGRISREQFKNDQKGFGLAQWTFFARKAALYDFWKTKGGSIGAEDLQVDFALLELRSDYAGLFAELKNSSDLEQCVTDVCYRFENPAVKNTKDRLNAALRIKDQIHLGPDPDPQPDPQPEPQPAPVPTGDIFWPPRIIDANCVDWPEVTVLGAVLYCRGYLNYSAGAWDDEVTEATKAFQRDTGLVPDGCVGPLTWSKLLERG